MASIEDLKGSVSGRRAFDDLVAAAIADIEEHGFDSQSRVDEWLAKLRIAAQRAMTPARELEDLLNRSLRSIYAAQVDRGGLLKMTPGVPRYTIANVKPKLRRELDRRIMASANLIKLNRQASIEKTLQRMSGWMSSVPAGGSDAVNRREVKADIKKALSQLPYEERRVLIDQGHKLVATLSNIVAVDGGAIAGQWHSHFRQANYDYRPDHKERDNKVYAVRGSWAIERGLINKGDGYTDEMTAPGEEVFCRCFMTWFFALRDLPGDMLTKDGKNELARVRAAA